MAPTDLIRRRVLFSGQVQGVGFRYTTQRVAQGFAVAGYVRNLPDGRVEVVVDGRPDEVARFVAAIQSTMEGYIGDVAAADQPLSQPFERFSIER